MFSHFLLEFNAYNYTYFLKGIGLNNTKGRTATKRRATNVPTMIKPPPISDFGVYIRSNEDTCMCCFNTIGQNSVRMIKIMHEIEEVGESMMLFYHLDCFAKHSLSLGWHEAVKNLPGFEELHDDDIKERIIRKMG